MVRLFRRVAFLRAPFDLRLRRLDHRQPFRATLQLLRNIQFRLRILCLRRLPGQRRHLAAQLLLEALRMPPAERPVPARVRLNLCPVQTRVAQLQQTRLLRDQQNPNEQPLQVLEKTPAETRSRVVVRMRVRRNVPERHRIAGRPLQPAARKDPRRAAVEQQTQQQRRMMRILPAATALTLQRAQVQPIHNVHHKPRQMIVRQPVLHRRRQKAGRVTIHWAKLRGHRSGVHQQRQTNFTWIAKSDRLLAGPLPALARTANSPFTGRLQEILLARNVAHRTW